MTVQWPSDNSYNGGLSFVVGLEQGGATELEQINGENYIIQAGMLTLFQQVLNFQTQITGHLLYKVCPMVQSSTSMTIQAIGINLME
jgi:hypothetical protein